MKKALFKHQFTLIGLLTFIWCLVFFNLSCGLDTYTVIDSPTTTYKVPTYDSLDKTEQYFEFRTEEDNQPSGDVVFLGTGVYYKIYNNYTTANSERSSLVNIANSDNTAGAADRMISTYSYKSLRASNYKGAVLIPNSGSNQRVKIRLSDYQASKTKDYEASITVNGNPINNASDVSKPLRCTDEKTFDFWNSANVTEDAIPEKDDEDVKYSSTTTEEGLWYVVMFAVSVARDTSYSYQYSNILYLGTVTITTDKSDNDP